MTVTMTGRALTERGARYAKQLASHLGSGFGATFAAGTATLVRDQGSATLASTDSSLEFAIEAPDPQTLFMLMAVIQGHLERFGAKEQLACVWDDRSVLAEYEVARERMAARRAAERRERGTLAR